MNRNRYTHTIISMMFLILFLIPSFAAAQDKKFSVSMQSQIERIKGEVEHNGHDFTVGYNPAMEYSLDQLCGLRIPNNWLPPDSRYNLKALTALPADFDWRSKNGVTPIKNQANCGSCWAFSAVGVFESAILINTGQEMDLSEQNLVNCNNRGYGCDGGMFDINDYHVSPGGTMESCSPYTAREGTCNSSCAKPYKLDRWAYASGSNPSVDQIKTAIATYGPVSAGVAADDSFQAYRSGIFRSSSTQMNHAIVLVGWNDNNGDGYWILKNSWGTGWGEQGYMKIAYGAANVGRYANYVVYKGGIIPPDPEDVNLLLNKPVYPSSSYSSSYPARNTVDGNELTYWASTQISSTNKRQSIWVDMLADKSVSKMKIKWSQTNYPLTYAIQQWTGSSWITVKNISGAGGWQEIDFTAPINNRYLRVLMTSSNSYFYTIYELQAY